jgi:hypothetical protein
MNWGITLWNTESLNHNFLAVVLFSPVQRALFTLSKNIHTKTIILAYERAVDIQYFRGIYLKFSQVRGTISARRVISIRPAGRPPIATSKKTTGFDIVDEIIHNTENS